MYRGTLVEFLNMGGGEIMLILVVVLLLFGGKKLPELARGLGKGLRDFKDASDGVKREIHRNINAAGITDEINDIKSTFSGDEISSSNNYDYKPGEQIHNTDSFDGGSGYSHDEAAHYNAGGETNTDNTTNVENATSDNPENSANVENTAQEEQVVPVNHNEHTEIETDKTKL